MNGDKDFERLDELLQATFRPSVGQATPGFEARVMARIMESGNEQTFWDILRVAAKPLLISGWAAAALLAVVALKYMGSGHDAVLATLMNGDSVSRWLVL